MAVLRLQIALHLLREWKHQSEMCPIRQKQHHITPSSDLLSRSAVLTSPLLDINHLYFKKKPALTLPAFLLLACFKPTVTAGFIYTPLLNFTWYSPFLFVPWEKKRSAGSYSQQLGTWGRMGLVQLFILESKCVILRQDAIVLSPRRDLQRLLIGPFCHSLKLSSS